MLGEGKVIKNDEWRNQQRRDNKGTECRCVWRVVHEGEDGRANAAPEVADLCLHHH